MTYFDAFCVTDGVGYFMGAKVPHGLVCISNSQFRELVDHPSI